MSSWKIVVTGLVSGLIWLAASPGVAAGQAGEEPADEASDPWERGVSREDRETASALFLEARALHLDLLREDALAKYREALEHWEHPNIHFNLTRLLLDMGSYMASYEHSERALAWGWQAHDEGEREVLSRIRAVLLESHLAVIEVRCDQPGAAVTLDGAAWFVGPGREHKVVRPGNHVVKAEGPGYFPLVEALAVMGGKQARVTLHMTPVATTEEPRRASWKPWALIGGGVAAGVVGTGLLWRAERALDRGDGRARWTRHAATGTLVAAGASIAVGVTLRALDRPVVRRQERSRSRATYELSPIVSGDTAGLSLRGVF